MERLTVLNYVKLACNELSIEVSEVTESTIFKNDLGFDSLDLVEFVMKAEAEYGIEIEGIYLEKIETVGEFIDVVIMIIENGHVE